MIFLRFCILVSEIAIKNRGNLQIMLNLNHLNFPAIFQNGLQPNYQLSISYKSRENRNEILNLVGLCSLFNETLAVCNGVLLLMKSINKEF